MTTTTDVEPSLRQWTFGAGIVDLACPDQGDVLAVTLDDGTLVWVDLASPDLAPSAPVRLHDGISLRLMADVTGTGVISGGDDGRLCTVRPGGPPETLAHLPGRWIDALAVSRAAGLRAMASGRRLQLIDATGTVRADVDDHPSTIAAIAFTETGKRLALAHYGGTTLRWAANPGTGTKLAWAGSHLSVTWGPEARFVVTGMQETGLHGWQLPKATNFFMNGYLAKTLSLSWNAQGKILATSGSDRVIAWDFSGKGPQGRPPRECGEPGAVVTDVAFHPRYDLLAFTREDGRVQVASPSGRTATLGAFDDRPSALVWSPDGRYLSAAGGRGSLSVWRMPSERRSG